MSHGFSEKALREQEPLIQEYCDLLMKRFYESCDNGTKMVDMVEWYNVRIGESDAMNDHKANSATFSSSHSTSLAHSHLANRLAVWQTAGTILGSLRFLKMSKPAATSDALLTILYLTQFCSLSFLLGSNDGAKSTKQ